MKPEDVFIETLRIQALAITVSGILRRRYGLREYYTAQEVEAACRQCNAPESTLQSAVAMFVRTEESEAVLQHLGSTTTALELRKALAQKIFLHYLPDVTCQARFNCFHDAANFQGDPGKAAAGPRKQRHLCGGGPSCSGGSSCGHACGGHACGGH